MGEPPIIARNSTPSIQQSQEYRATSLRNHQERILDEARNTKPKEGYKQTNYEFQGVPVYLDSNKIYRLSTGHMVFRRDLEKKKK